MREHGVVETLCREIDFPFEKSLERVDVLTSFVLVLVDEILHMHAVVEHIATLGGSPASSNVRPVADLLIAGLKSPDSKAIQEAAALVHARVHEVAPEDQYPCDQLVHLLSACASAVRFGLEVPCRSRHAADAAASVWERVYGIRRHDQFTSGWRKEWTRAQLIKAITSLIGDPDHQSTVPTPNRARGPS